MRQKTVGTTSTTDNWCREDGFGKHGKETWEMRTFAVPSREIETFLAQSPGLKHPVICPQKILPHAHFWDTDTIRSAQVTPTAPRLHGTT